MRRRPDRGRAAGDGEAALREAEASSQLGARPWAAQLRRGQSAVCLAECGWTKNKPPKGGYFFFVAFFFVVFFAVAIVDITSLPVVCRSLSNGTST
jgi:hypothetical protein